MRFIEGLEGQRLLVLEELLLAVRRRKSERKLREEECAVDVLDRPPSPRLPRALISLFGEEAPLSQQQQQQCGLRDGLVDYDPTSSE